MKPKRIVHRPTGRVFYRVNRPTVPIDCAWALVHAVSGAGLITIALQIAGLIR